MDDEGYGGPGDGKGNAQEFMENNFLVNHAVDLSHSGLCGTETAGTFCS